MEEAQLLYVTTPVAELGITATPRAVTSVFFRAQPPTAASGAREVTRGEAQRLLREAADQLEEYFAGLRRRFTLPLELRGTPFQRAVWEAVGRIPYGEVRSYARIAAEIGRPGACRAVGMAMRAAWRPNASCWSWSGTTSAIRIRRRLRRMCRKRLFSETYSPSNRFRAVCSVRSYPSMQSQA